MFPCISSALLWIYSGRTTTIGISTLSTFKSVAEVSPHYISFAIRQFQIFLFVILIYSSNAFVITGQYVIVNVRVARFQPKITLRFHTNIVFIHLAFTF